MPSESETIRDWMENGYSGKNPPVTIDGIPMWDYVEGMRAGPKPKAKPKEQGMSDSPLQIMMGDDRSKTKMRALSNGLRRKKEIGYLAQLSGDAGVDQFGRGLADEVDTRSRQRMLEREKKLQRDMTQGQYDANNAHRGLVLEETIKHHRAIERAAMMKAGKGKDPTEATQKRAEEGVGKFTGLKNLRATFDDDYANNSNIPWEGQISNAVPDVFKSQKMKEQQDWWKAYRRQYELGARNTLFGSALTDSEIRAWNAANIDPNSTPDIIRTALDHMQMVQQQVLTRMSQRDATLYNDDWVATTYGGLEFENFDHLQGAGSSGRQAPTDWGSPEVGVNEATGNKIEDWGGKN